MYLGGKMSAFDKDKCPICGTERDSLDANKSFPFCSEKCQLVDLWGWFNEEYIVPESLPQTNEDPEEPEPFWRN